MNIYQKQTEFLTDLKTYTIKSIRQDLLDRKNKRTEANINKMKKLNMLDQNPIDQNFKKLMINNFNYSYTVYLEQCKLKTVDIILQSDILNLLNISLTDKQNRKNFENKKSVLQILVSELEKINKKKDQKGVQTIQKQPQMYTETYYERRLNQIKAQLQQIYKSDYQSKLQEYKRIQSIKIKDELKQKIKKDFEKQKNNKLKQLELLKNVLNKKEAEVIQIYNNKLKQINQQLKNLHIQNSTLKLTISDIEFKNQKHQCIKSPIVQKYLAKLQQESKALKSLQNQYKLAISNINTRVEDIIQLKQKIHSKKQEEKYIDNNKKLMRLNDQVGRSLLNSIENLERRVEILSKQNSSFMMQQNIKGKKILYLQKQVSRLQQNIIKQQEQVNKLNSYNTRNVVIHKKNIGINVNQQEIKNSYKELNKQEEQQKDNQQQMLQYVDNLRNNKLVFVKNVENISYEMKAIKRKVRMLIDNQII